MSTRFFVRAHGKTMPAAFKDAINEAHKGGYGDALAAKGQFITVSVPPGKNPFEHAHDVLDDGNHMVCDPNEPAGCIDLGENDYLFFGTVDE